jgi:hypothetical protein
MKNPVFVWGALAMITLIAIGYGLRLPAREGPTPLGEIFGIGGVAAVLALAFFPLGLIPVGIAVVIMLLEHRS